jgi:hypothetical protein
MWDALALGQIGSLGELRWRNGLCGQVLDVDCGNGPVRAVVASTCMLGTDACGADLVQSTWDRATNNKSPGEEWCTVSLTDANPLPGGPRCYARPDSGGLDNAWYISVGVFNTKGRIPQWATLHGVQGQFMSDSQYFQFHSDGRDLFRSWSELVFHFEDGSAETFQLGNCEHVRDVQIF